MWLRDNVLRCWSWAHWKARSGLPITVNWNFFARCYGRVATSETRSTVGDFAPTGVGWLEISGRRSRHSPPTNHSSSQKTAEWFFVWYKSGEIFLPFLANVINYVIVRPSVVCLSIVCNVRAPYSGDWNFRQYFYDICHLCVKILRRSSQEPGCISWHFCYGLLLSLVAGCSAGLQTAYMTDDTVHRLCKLLFALPFLPACEIATVSDKLERKALRVDHFADNLSVLFTYVRQTCLDSTVWPPHSWSVYKRPIRTNNDLEGWHFRLNSKARKNSLPMYVLLKLLYREASSVSWQTRLLSDGKVLRRRHNHQHTVEASLLKYWDEYDDGKRSAYKLLRACSHIYSPSVNAWL